MGRYVAITRFAWALRLLGDRGDWLCARFNLCGDWDCGPGLPGFPLPAKVAWQDRGQLEPRAVRGVCQSDLDKVLNSNLSPATALGIF